MIKLIELLKNLFWINLKIKCYFLLHFNDKLNSFYRRISCTPPLCSKTFKNQTWILPTHPTPVPLHKIWDLNFFQYLLTLPRASNASNLQTASYAVLLLFYIIIIISSSTIIICSLRFLDQLWLFPVEHPNLKLQSGS